MNLIEIKKVVNYEQNKRLIKRYSALERLIQDLAKRDIPAEVTESVNREIEKVNSIETADKTLSKQLRKSISEILTLVEKKLKLVPKNLYRTRWMAIGMSGFGVPIGVAFGVSMDNMRLLAIGIGVGMVIGMAIGAGMDKKAAAEGRQLDIEMSN